MCELLNVVADFDGVGATVGGGGAVGVMSWRGDEEGVEVAEEAVDSHGF